MTEVQQDVPVEEAPEMESMEKVGTDGTATVGGQLRLAREAAGLTTADVAQSLKFSQRQVEQLEADDYEALPGTTIVRGFTRSYARLLGLDGAALLQLLDTRTPSVPVEVRPPDNMGIAGTPGGLRQLTPLTSAAIVIALAAVLIGLWQYFSPELPVVPATVEKHDNGTTAAIERVPLAPAVPAPSAAQPAADSALAPASPDVLPAAPAAGPLLVFLFEDRSWLEVTDAAQQVLHTGESPAGSRLELSGKPPFDVVVGNAGKVKASYGEREIDLAPHTRADVARLKIE